MSTTRTLKIPRPHIAQRTMLRQAKRWNVADCGRRLGKSTLGEDRLISAVLPGHPVAYYAPNYRMMAEVWRDMLRVLKPVTVSHHVDDRRIDILGGGVVEFWSLTTPDASRGRKYKRVVIDEAAMVPHLEDTWNKVIRPTLTDLRGDAWFLSTPRGFNFFHKLYQRGQSEDFPNYASWRMPSSANPFLPASEIDEARDETPENVFNQEWLALFVDDATTIFSPTWYEDGRNRFDPTELLRAEMYAGRWLSWDTAFKDTKNAAYSACVVGELLAPEFLPGRAWQLQIREVFRDRLNFPALVDESIRLIQKHDKDNKLRAILIEDAASGQSLVPTLQLAMPAYADAIVGVPVREGNKADRAARISPWCRNGSVLLPTAGPSVNRWLTHFEEELYEAPFSREMDQVDAFVQMIHWLEPYLAEGYRMRHGRLAVA